MVERVFSAVGAFLGRLELAAVIVAGGCILAIMGIAGADVFARYAVNRPFAWSYDLISLFLLTGAFYLFLADTQRRDEHIAVDLVHNRVGPRTRHAMYALCFLLAIPAIWIMLAASFRNTRRAFVNNEVLMGAIHWPTWIASGLVLVGLALLLARLVHAGLGHALSAATGRSHVPLPTSTGSMEV